MELSELIKLKGIKNPKKRIGRGIGSGKGGHTVGRGTKGQKARKGKKVNVGFEGGQVPLYKRLPQIGGFKNHRSKQIAAVSLTKLNVFKDGDTITPFTLADKKIIRGVPKHGVKILSVGKLIKKLTLKGFLYSESALEKVNASGSKVDE